MIHCDQCSQPGAKILKIIFGVPHHFCSDKCWKLFKRQEFSK